MIKERGAPIDMTTMTNLLGNTAQSGHLRPLDVRRDLGGVADLVEQCFADTLDSDGQRYIQQMRSLSHNPGTLNWISSLSERSPLPLSGFVWEEDKRIVGNLTLIPYNLHQAPTMLIANVAVHPDYRRRGIAYRLTAKAIDHARQRGIRTTWLHVREENEPAIKLYRSLGFQERARRTTWICDSKATPLQDENGRRAVTPAQPVHIGERRTQDWHAQESWLRRLYPAEVTWHLSLKPAWLRPGVTGFFYRHVQRYQLAAMVSLAGRPLDGCAGVERHPLLRRQSLAGCRWRERRGGGKGAAALRPPAALAQAPALPGLPGAARTTGDPGCRLSRPPDTDLDVGRHQPPILTLRSIEIAANDTGKQVADKLSLPAACFLDSAKS